MRWAESKSWSRTPVLYKCKNNSNIVRNVELSAHMESNLANLAQKTGSKQDIIDKLECFQT